ncbi:OB-fold protein [Flavobacteriaceae bacterium LMO-SS05]
MRKWIIILVLLVLVYLVYNYIYQEHRNIESETSEFVMNSIDIANEFAINPSASEKKYLNKTIEIKGTITELNDTDLTLDHTVFCQFDSKIKIDTDNVKVKGRFIGYDDLLEQIKLDQCSILID